MEKVILHIDFDSFFASCEQQFDVSLRGKAIGVTATNGRTCIIAASREAKKTGVTNVSRVWEARKICPEIITVPAHFEKYWEITQKFLDICKDYSPYVELFSLDEVFMDITSTENLFGGRYKIIEIIKTRIRNEIGQYITVSVGLSYNRLLAKLASGLNKPNGFMEIRPENVKEVYSQVKLTDFCGIGFRIEKRLNKLGVYTPLQLRAASLDTLIEEFKDVEGHFLKNLGLGEDESEVIPYYEPVEAKSVGRSYCMPQNQYDQRIILQNIFELCEEVGKKLRKLEKKSRTIGLFLTGTNSFHGRKTITDYIHSGRDIYTICKVLYDEWGLGNCSRCNQNQECKGTCPEQSRRMVRQISVWAGNLENSRSLTISIFDESSKNEKIQAVMDRINDKFGHNSIRNGFVANGPNLKTVPNGYGADRFDRQKLAQAAP